MVVVPDGSVTDVVSGSPATAYVLVTVRGLVSVPYAGVVTVTVRPRVSNVVHVHEVG